VVHGEIGKTPPSKVSLLDPDIHVSRLGCCDGADVEVKSIIGLLLDSVAEGEVVVGSIVFVAVGSVVATGKAIAGLLPDGIAEGGEVFVLIVFVAVGPVVAKDKVVVGLLLGSIAEGREVFGLPVSVAVGTMVANSVGGEGIVITGGNTEFIPCSRLVNFPLFDLDDFAPLPKSFGFFDDTATSLE
jgi:hypothetical protein